ncbi:MAG: trypsin-like peptidase domain-containing protein [Clostridiales bacterium]|nr:trypsin-like peptidase domain-containing protein [Clostridiales bacterium]MDY5514724.1 trypsin-like peptidase domain-containing protein [Candidatus Ventricola sp.]
MRTSRRFRRLVALTAAFALLVTASLAITAQAAESQFTLIENGESGEPLSVREIAKDCRTSVVAIETETKVVENGYDNYYPFGMFGYGYGYGYGNGNRGGSREYTQTGAGSGIILSEDGYILTNNHVISGADKITVYVMPEDEDGEETTYEATLIGSSESHDIAVLKIDATGLNAASFGDSDGLELGEPAVVIGNPMGKVHGSVTAGIISATEQELTIDDVTINAIQTDAAINPGNSGGALFDEYGNVVGVVYAKSSSVSIEGIGYAIPVNNVKELVAQMINDPESVQAQTKGSQIMLGITIQNVTEELSKRYSMPVGVYVNEVSSMSAAERAGVQKGDIIVEFAGETVTDADSLNAIKAQQTPGDTVTMKVDRNGTEVELKIVIPQPTEVDTEK